MDSCTGHVVKSKPVEKSIELIGLDFGRNNVHFCGTLVNTGCIYCPPGDVNSRNMLKLNASSGSVETMDLELRILFSAFA